MWWTWVWVRTTLSCTECFTTIYWSPNYITLTPKNILQKIYWFLKRYASWLPENLIFTMKGGEPSVHHHVMQSNTFNERILCWCVIQCRHLTNQSAFLSVSLRFGKSECPYLAVRMFEFFPFSWMSRASRISQASVASTEHTSTANSAQHPLCNPSRQKCTTLSIVWVDPLTKVLL